MAVEQYRQIIQQLRQEFPELMKLPSMWTRAYFVSTAGNVASSTIQKYIDAQGKG